MQFIIGFYRLYFKLLSFISVKAAGKAAIKLFSTPLKIKERPLETEILSSAEKSKFKFGENNLAVYKWGQANKKALLVHGWEGNAGSMGGFVKPLLDAGYQVTALDGPAHGKSEGKQTNLFEYADAVTAIIKETEPVDLIIAHSFGSAVSLYAMIQEPSIIINKMVMLTTPDKLEVPFHDFFRLMKLTVPVQNEMYHIVTKKYGVLVEDISVSGLCNQAKIKSCMLIHDTEDKIIPYEYSKRVAEKFPVSKLISFKNIGHYRMLWNKDVIKCVGEFVKE